MTLEDAIKRAEDVARRKCGSRGDEHKQLAEWLKELAELRLRLMEFEKKREIRYEYACLFGRNGKPFAKSSIHYDSLADASTGSTYCPYDATVSFIRREVGRWEVVK